MPRTILLTGSASGIGRHLTSVFLSQGDRVLATDINESGLEEAKKEENWPSDRVELMKLDIRSAGDWQTALSKAPQVDVLINNAGYLLPGYAHEFAFDSVDRHIDINVKGVMLGTRIIGEAMVKAGRGHIINVASLAGITPVPGNSLYAASKFAVRGFSLSVAAEFQNHGVDLTVICPDAVQTPMLDLQTNYEEAALTFSGPKALTVKDIENAIFRALKKKTLEITLPASRGWMAKISSFFPALAFKLAPLLLRKGKSQQKTYKALT